MTGSSRPGYSGRVDITWVTSLVGALGIGSFITSQVASWRQRKEKLGEREATRDESHRDQLRRAYAEFISAYSKFLDAAGLMHSINRAMHELLQEADMQQGGNIIGLRAAEGAIIPEFQERGRRAIEDFVAASSDANTKGVAVLLLDDDDERRRRTLVLADARLTLPQSQDDYARFHADILRLRAVLDELTEALGGAFSPDRWHQEVADRRRALIASKRRHARLPVGQSDGASPVRTLSSGIDKSKSGGEG